MERRPLILRQESEDIYRVWYGDKRVGTIMHYTSGPDPFWEWSISAVHSALGGPARGVAAKKTLAMKAFRETFDTILDGPHSWMPEPPKWTPFRKEGLG
jgi:hypothetical protein